MRRLATALMLVTLATSAHAGAAGFKLAPNQVFTDESTSAKGSWPESKIACTYDVAARLEQSPRFISTDEIVNEIRSKNCEVVPANTQVAVAPTKHKRVVYATQNGVHLGYVPMDMWVTNDVAKILKIPQVGECRDTRIKSLGYRLGDPGTGSVVDMVDGTHQVGYQDVITIENSQLGDPVRLCIVDVERACPVGTGITYRTTNKRTGDGWTLADSTKSCE